MTVLDAVEIERHEDPWEAVPVIGGTLVDARAEGAGEAVVPDATGEFSVHCDSSGNPCALFYRGRGQRVLQPVIHWYERCNWWDLADRVPRESPTSAVDRERWRVQAVEAGAAVARTFELTRDQSTGQWGLLRVSC